MQKCAFTRSVTGSSHACSYKVCVCVCTSLHGTQMLCAHLQTSVSICPYKRSLFFVNIAVLRFFYFVCFLIFLLQGMVRMSTTAMPQTPIPISTTTTPRALSTCPPTSRSNVPIGNSARCANYRILFRLCRAALQRFLDCATLQCCIDRSVVRLPYTILFC